MTQTDTGTAVLNTNYPNKKQIRIEYYDILRGIAIIFVIAIHAVNFSVDKNAPISNYAIFWRNIISFAVPLFIAISGFFMAGKNLESPAVYFSFLKKQLPRILIPYVVWSLFYSVFLFRGGTSIGAILIKFITFQSSVPFYFIALITQLYVLSPIAQKLANKRGLILTVGISVLFCAFLYYVRYSLDKNPPIILYAGLFFPFFFFYVLGIYFGKGHSIIKSRLTGVLLVVVSLLLLIFDSILEYNTYQNFNAATSTVKISSLLYAFCIISLLFNHKNLQIKNTFLAYLGSVSFGVYFFHMFVLARIAKPLKGIFPAINTVLFQSLFILTALLLCMLFCFVIRKINTKLSSKYLGI